MNSIKKYMRPMNSNKNKINNSKNKLYNKKYAFFS